MSKEAARGARGNQTLIKVVHTPKKMGVFPVVEGRVKVSRHPPRLFAHLLAVPCGVDCATIVTGDNWTQQFFAGLCDSRVSCLGYRGAIGVYLLLTLQKLILWRVTEYVFNNWAQTRSRSFE